MSPNSTFDKKPNESSTKEPIKIRVVRRYFDLCKMINFKWFWDPANLFSLANFLAKHPVADKQEMLHTYLLILKKKCANYDHDRAVIDFNKAIDSKYPATLTERTLKQLAGSNLKYAEEYKKWKEVHVLEPAREQKAKRSNSVDEIPRSESFELTFDSDLINAELMKVLISMNKSFDIFKEVVCDPEFGSKELAFWAKKHCSIRNQAHNDYQLSWLDFEKIIKMLVFDNYEIAERFISYFINEFFMFGRTMSSCFMRIKVNKYNSLPLTSYSTNEFKNINIAYKLKSPVERTVHVSLFEVFKSLPMHKFTHECHAWNHDPTDMETFSLAIPFQYEQLDEVITEDDLPDWMLYYFKRVLCDNNNEWWEWLREYMANIIHQPNAKTDVMLVLYSQEKRCGKSTLLKFLQKILSEANIAKIENIKDAFGDRGGTPLVGKRVGWFEELTGDKNTFRNCMDRMKTSITEKRMTYKPLYSDLKETTNRCEYIACTNNLVGVLGDRMTVFHVSDIHRNDHVFYGMIESNYTQDVANRLAAYLKNYTTRLPMKSIDTAIGQSMANNGKESICTFLDQIKTGDLNSSSEFGTVESFELLKAKSYEYISKQSLYDMFYRSWCYENNESVLSFGKFKEKLTHYDRYISYAKIKNYRNKDDQANGVAKASFWAFKFPNDWVKLVEAEVEI